MSLSYDWPLSNILIIHLGGNDIGKRKTLDLIFYMCTTIQQFKALSPSTDIVFSTIIPRLVWINFAMLKPFEEIPKQINRMLEKCMSLGYVFTFCHRDLKGVFLGISFNII